MAHIADLMVETRLSVGLNNYIARELFQGPSRNGKNLTVTTTPVDEKERYVWRMHRRCDYSQDQLAPEEVLPSRGIHVPMTGRKSPDPERLLSLALAQADRDRLVHKETTRAKPKEQNLVRRRKISVPELGLMTTVHEVPMDSPTIPGRPPLHERSISAPGNSWRLHRFGESLPACVDGSAQVENHEVAILDTQSFPGRLGERFRQIATCRQESRSPKQLLSPKTLAPLVIPSSSAPQSRSIWQTSTRPRPDSPPPEVPPKSARFRSNSPYTPFTPMSASTTSLASTAPISRSNTPISAPERRTSPKQWSGSSSPNQSFLGHSRGQSETTYRSTSAMSHRRGDSETSIMDRGRPKKRPDGSPLKKSASQTTLTPTEQQRAFERLPSGYRPREASCSLSANELDALRKQAIGQATRFAVLGSKDVENLSRELRSLDERCDYLRKTHRSLRSGRRNLHDRICTYLRSPRVARFSHESILKQEEALSELDASIDDWISKLELAENRRTRIRQKLLEHVAAALIIPPTTPTKDKGVMMENNKESRSTGENTPPRSPKSQSPRRLAAPLRVESPLETARQSAESIRIYADGDVYALLADVEDEMNRMGDQSDGGHEAAVNAGIMLNAVTFSPQRPVGYGTAAF